MKKIIRFTAILILLAGCKQVDNAIPDDYYMTCKIDGKDWKAKFGNGLGEQGTEAKLLFNGTVFRILGKSDDQSISLGLLDTNSRFENIINLTQNCSGCYTSHAQYSRFLAFEDYSTDSLRVGSATVERIDKNKMVVTGSFYFQAYNSQLSDSIYITDGKFRMKYELH